MKRGKKMKSECEVTLGESRGQICLWARQDRVVMAMGHAKGVVMVRNMVAAGRNLLAIRWWRG